MRFQLVTMRDGQVYVNWPLVMVYVALVPVVVIGGVEWFWRWFAGGYSPLLGGFGLIASILIVIRLVGEVVARRSRLTNSLTLKT
jgi:hypothetical protein